MINARAEIAAALEVLRGQAIPKDKQNKNAWMEPIIEAVLPLLAEVWEDGYDSGINELRWEQTPNPYREQR